MNEEKLILLYIYLIKSNFELNPFLEVNDIFYIYFFYLFYKFYLPSISYFVMLIYLLCFFSNNFKIYPIEFFFTVDPNEFFIVVLLSFFVLKY